MTTTTTSSGTVTHYAAPTSKESYLKAAETSEKKKLQAEQNLNKWRDTLNSLPGDASDEEYERVNKKFELAEKQLNYHSNQVEKFKRLAEAAPSNAEIAKLEAKHNQNSTPSTPPSDGSAIQEQQVTSTSGGTTIETKSMGNGSNLVNTTQEVKSNGDMTINSDLGTTSIKQNDSSAVNQGNNISSTNGNDSSFTNGLNETTTGSSSRIVGNAYEVQEGITDYITNSRSSVVAGRSGFNDDRENKKLGLDDLINDVIGFPKAVLEGISKTLEEVATDEDRPKETKGKDLFASMMDNIEKETKPIIDKWKKAAAEAKKEQMAALAKNKVEKMKKQLEAIKKMPESAHKQRLIKAINEGKIEDTYGALNNERKEKNSTFDQNKYDEEVIKYIEKVLELERMRS